MRKSHANASSNPPVTATPLMAPITGFDSGGNGPRPPMATSALRKSSFPDAASFRSTPALNAGSTPVRMTTSTPSSASAWPASSRRSRDTSVDSALRDSGRLMVMVATRSATS
jgi:hypothetical protein